MKIDFPDVFYGKIQPMAYNKILIIESDRGFCHLIRAYLEKKGFTVIVSYNFQTGLSKIVEQLPDLIVTLVKTPYAVLDLRHAIESVDNYYPHVFPNDDNKDYYRTFNADDDITQYPNETLLDEIMKGLKYLRDLFKR